jgi:hypothetical protein
LINYILFVQREIPADIIELKLNIMSASRAHIRHQAPHFQTRFCHAVYVDTGAEPSGAPATGPIQSATGAESCLLLASAIGPSCRDSAALTPAHRRAILFGVMFGDRRERITRGLQISRLVIRANRIKERICQRSVVAGKRIRIIASGHKKSRRGYSPRRDQQTRIDR